MREDNELYYFRRKDRAKERQQCVVFVIEYDKGMFFYTYASEHGTTKNLVMPL